MSDRKKSACVNVKARARLFEQAPTEAQPPRQAGSSGSAEARKRRAESALKAGTVRQVLRQVEEKLETGHRKNSTSSELCSTETTTSLPESDSSNVKSNKNDADIGTKESKDNKAEEKISDEKNAGKNVNSDVKESELVLKSENSDKVADASKDIKRKSSLNKAEDKKAEIKINSEKIQEGSHDSNDKKQSGSRDNINKKEFSSKKETSEKTPLQNLDNSRKGKEDTKPTTKVKLKKKISEKAKIKSTDINSEPEVSAKENKNESKPKINDDTLKSSTEKNYSEVSVEVSVKKQADGSHLIITSVGSSAEQVDSENKAVSDNSVEKDTKIHEEKQVLSSESESNNPCLLCEPQQPEWDPKIVHLLPEECTEESAESRSSTGSTGADLLTTAVTSKSNSHDNQEQGIVSEGNSDGNHIGVVPQVKTVSSSFWRRLSDSGSSISSSASDVEVPQTEYLHPIVTTTESQGYGSREPSAFLTKLGLVLSRSSTSSPELINNNEQECNLNNYIVSESDYYVIEKEKVCNNNNDVSLNKPVNIRNPLRTESSADKVLSSAVKHDAKFVHPSLKSFYVPAGSDQTIFSASSSVEKWRFKSDELPAISQCNDYEEQSSREVNPTLQELLTSVQKIQEEFGKDNYNTVDKSYESVHLGNQPISNSTKDVIRSHLIQEKHPHYEDAESRENKFNFIENAVSIPHSLLHQEKIKQTNDHGSKFIFSPTAHESVHEGRQVDNLSQLGYFGKLYEPYNSSENFLNVPVTQSYGPSESDRKVGSHNNVLTTDESRMERRVNPMKHSNIVTPGDKTKRPVNISPISVKQFDTTVPDSTNQSAAANPLSPTAKIQVRPKPELPAYFTLGRKTFQKSDLDSSRYESGTFSDSERTDLEKIESILSELDFSKYRRGRSTHLTVQHTLPRSFSESPRPGSRQPLPSKGQSKHQITPSQSTQSATQQKTSPKLQHQKSFPPERSSVSRTLQSKSNREKLKELTERLKPSGKLQEVVSSSPLTTSPPIPSLYSDHHQHQQLLLQQQLQNQQLQQQLLQQQQQLQQLQQQHLEQIQQLQRQQQNVSSGIQNQAVRRSASLSHVDFADEPDDTWKDTVVIPTQVESKDQYCALPSGPFTFLPQTMNSDKSLTMTVPELNVEIAEQNRSDLSTDSVLDAVSDEGLVADSDATSSFVQTYRTITSMSAPATPCLRQRSDTHNLEGRLESVASSSKMEEPSIHLSASDKRKRRKGNVGFQTNSFETPNKSGNGRSLTYPPQRKGSVSEGMEFTSVDSNGMKSYLTNLASVSSVSSADATRQMSELSLADSHFCPSEVNMGETYQDVVESVVHEPSEIDRLDDRSGKTLKKKHYSDPSGDKNDGLLDLPELIASCKSEPQLGDKPLAKDSGLRLQIVEATAEPITQVPGSVGMYPFQQSPRTGLRLSQSTPISSGSDGYSSDKDKYSQKSPQQQRRYSKKRLRGPYGEMLEEEMRKSGEKHLQKLSIAEELSFLQDLMESKPSNSTSVGGSVNELDSNALYGSSNVNSLREDTWGDLQLLHQERQDNISDNTASDKQPQDTRTHVVGELYDTERSYVESLQILVNKYYHPLKSPENAGLVDSALVDDMFFQIPEILVHHEAFLELLRHRLENWDGKQKVGDVFVEAFTKQQVINTYTAFINNWKAAKEAIKIAVQAKPAFAKFLEHMSREHKGKLTLDALLIMPVQRIPRYELLIKELLKHTQVDHPDHRLLVLAQKEVHDLAVKINRMEREAYEAEQMQQKLKEIENLIDGLIDLVHPDRSFIRYDLVTMSGGLGTKKERCLFLFSDLLIITSIKRKSGTIRKTSSASNSPASLYNTLEMNKYKLLMKLSLDDLDIAKSNDSTVKKALKEMEQLEEDSTLLGQISDLVNSLNCSHQVEKYSVSSSQAIHNLDELIRDMQGIISKQLQDKHNTESQLMLLELTVTTQEGIENLSMIFSSVEKRASWETALSEAKQKLALSSDYRPPPEFLTPLPIRKTRAGLQFTCAAPTLGLNSHNFRDVWVCNSDGYVGQVCVLSLQPEATVTSCNGVCNARILCITSVPAVTVPHESYAQRRRAYTDSKRPVSISVVDVDERNEKKNNANIQLDSESSEEEDEGIESQEDEVRKKRGDSLPLEESTDVDNQQPTMWLGTEDGCIHVYNCNDNIRIKKNKVKLQHSAAIHSIIHMDNKIFVSLANGDLTVYKHDPNGGWNTSEPETVTIGSSVTPITKMAAVTGKLWCGCQNSIKVINTSTLEVEQSFIANPDPTRSVLCIATAGLGVWISIQNSANIRLFHATSYECLLDISVAPSVTKMLAGCDDIIRQHKAACLRVTALLACKDLIWVGTSAGVVLNITVPHLTTATTKLSSMPNISGIHHGHTGHVRFLSCVELQPYSDVSSRSKYSGRSLKVKDGHALSRRSSISAMMANKMLVISGGDGYEDFRNTNVGESAGRDDSTNHLLLWQV